MKLYEKVFYFISGHGRGWAFSSNDLIKKFDRQQIDSTLSDLVKEKKIRRVSRGIYDYPKYSELLQKELSPDVEQVARAIARKFNWRIEVSGESALNILNLSTQIEAKYIYLSDGPNKSYKLFNDVEIEFKKSVLKDIGFRYKESSLIVQALKSLGKEHITEEIIEKIKEQIEFKIYEKILKDTQSTTVWVYEIIKQICKGDSHE